MRVETSLIERPHGVCWLGARPRTSQAALPLAGLRWEGRLTASKIVFDFLRTLCCFEVPMPFVSLFALLVLLVGTGSANREGRTTRPARPLSLKVT